MLRREKMIPTRCIHHILDTWWGSAVYSKLKRYFWVDIEVVVVKKDLSLLTPFSSPQQGSNLRFVEIEKKEMERGTPLSFHECRWRKIFRYLKKGFTGFAILKGNEVVGDVWCSDQATYEKAVKDLDLKWLDIHLGEREAYLFDMYVKPEERGKGSVNFLLAGALRSLREKGVHTAYGYYSADNIPALWVHRMLGYKELRKVRLKRFLFLNRTTVKTLKS